MMHTHNLAAAYLILDAARCGNDLLNEAKTLQPIYQSLYQDKADPSLQSFAPHLFPCRSNQRLLDFFFINGWGHSWGILIETPASLHELYRHFEKFIFIPADGKRRSFFRFYDPRVFREILPTYFKHQQTHFFGPVQYFISEDSRPEYALRYRLENQWLKTDQLTIGETASESKSSTIENPTDASTATGKNSASHSSKPNLWLD